HPQRTVRRYRDLGWVIEFKRTVPWLAHPAQDLAIQRHRHHVHGNGVDHVQLALSPIDRQPGAALEDTLIFTDRAQGADKLEVGGEYEDSRAHRIGDVNPAF